MPLDRDDHDLLICIEEKLRELKQQFSNHLTHHFAVTVCALGATLSAFTALAGVIILLCKSR